MIDYAALESTADQNWYELDPDLQARVKRDCPPEDYDWADHKLREFGALIGGPVARNADIADANPPELLRYDKWANDKNEVSYHPATLDSKEHLWKIGYVSGFANDEAQRGRSTPAVVLAAANYLLAEADTGLVCSLGMTSGVAGLVDRYAPDDIRDELLTGLRGSDLESGTDGSMFLTERLGGSDLGRTIQCTASDLGDGRVLVNGEKWFCSNIDGSAIALLARPEGAPFGSASIGLYLVPRYLEDGSLNNIEIRRLKDKLGTKSVPTGEVELRDAIGYALRTQSGDGAGSDSRGLNRMMEMVNGSRFGVAMMGLGIARRSFLEAVIWAHHREASGRLLVDLPLMREQIVDLQVELEAAFALGFECAAASKADDGERLRRILVPAAKARLCRIGVETASTAIEVVGGNGYCEDWGLTRQLRDAQCHPIWEGSENICMLDVLRAIRRDQAHLALLARTSSALDTARAGGPAFIAGAVVAVETARNELAARIDKIDALDRDTAESNAAHLTNLLVQVTSASLLLEQGATDVRKALVGSRYVRRHLDADGAWDDRIAARLGPEILSHASIDETEAAQAVA